MGQLLISWLYTRRQKNTRSRWFTAAELRPYRSPPPPDSYLYPDYNWYMTVDPRAGAVVRRLTPSNKSSFPRTAQTPVNPTSPMIYRGVYYRYSRNRTGDIKSFWRRSYIIWGKSRIYNVDKVFVSWFCSFRRLLQEGGAPRYWYRRQK